MLCVNEVWLLVGILLWTQNSFDETLYGKYSGMSWERLIILRHYIKTYTLNHLVIVSNKYPCCFRGLWVAVSSIMIHYYMLFQCPVGELPDSTEVGKEKWENKLALILFPPIRGELLLLLLLLLILHEDKT